MTAANSLHRSVGALSFPIAAGVSADLSDLDPARDILLDLFAAAINAELAPRWSSVVNGTPLWDSTPVKCKLPAMPEPETLSQVKTEWPLLTVSRADNGCTVEDFSLDRVKETWRWDVDYILGPLTIGNALALRDGLLAVARVLVLTMQQSGHRAYAEQGDYAKNVLGAGVGCCNFSSSRVVDYKFGVAQLSQNGPKYHACSMTLETVELSRLNDSGFPDAGSYKGNSVTLRTGTEQGLKTIVVADSAVPLP